MRSGDATPGARCSMALWGMLLFMGGASDLAAQVAFTPNESRLPMPPGLYVGSQAPGTVLFTSTLAQSRKVDPATAPAFSTALPGGVPVAGYANVYQTNIPGIGVRFHNILYTNAVPTGTPVYGVGAASNGLASTLPQQRVRFDLVRIPGEVVAGTLEVPLPYRVSFNCGTAANCRWHIYATGTTAITTGTCRTPASVSVPLGDHQVTDFRAVGTASPWVDFAIDLNSCPAGYTQLSYRLVPGQAPVDQGLLALEPGGATGVAVELEARDGTVSRRAVFDTPQPLRAAPGTPDVNVPFRARILQTGLHPGPGAVKASMEVRIEYR